MELRLVQAGGGKKDGPIRLGHGWRGLLQLFGDHFEVRQPALGIE
jgi:hypothetical protein